MILDFPYQDICLENLCLAFDSLVFLDKARIHPADTTYAARVVEESQKKVLSKFHGTYLHLIFHQPRKP